MDRQRPFCTLSRFKLLQVDQGSSVPLAKCSFGTISLSRHSVDRSPRAFHSSTHNVVRVSCFEVLSASVKHIATVMRSRRLEWFGHVKRRDETDNIRAVVEMKMERKRPRGRPTLRWKDTVRRDLKAWSIREEWATDRERWNSMCKNRYPAQGDGGER